MSEKIYTCTCKKCGMTFYRSEYETTPHDVCLTCLDSQPLESCTVEAVQADTEMHSGQALQD